MRELPHNTQPNSRPREARGQRALHWQAIHRVAMREAREVSSNSPSHNSVDLASN